MGKLRVPRPGVALVLCTWVVVPMSGVLVVLGLGTASCSACRDPIKVSVVIRLCCTQIVDVLLRGTDISLDLLGKGHHLVVDP